MGDISAAFSAAKSLSHFGFLVFSSIAWFCDIIYSYCFWVLHVPLTVAPHCPSWLGLYRSSGPSVVQSALTVAQRPAVA